MKKKQLPQLLEKKQLPQLLEMTVIRDGARWVMERFDLVELRRANVSRLPEFKNRHGGAAHSEPDGSDWALSTWSNAVLGELGELANLIKKIERGDYTLDEKREDLGKEGADVLTYLDILMFRCGVDLGHAVRMKFNEVSERVGASTFIDKTGEAYIAAGPED